MGLLNGRVAVITCGTRGFGLAVARAYVREGAAVLVSSRSQDAVQKAVAVLTENGGRAAGFSADVSDRSQVEQLAAHATSTFGRFDIWVNNAGIAGTFGPTMDIDRQSFVQVVETNILGAFYGSSVAMQSFLARRSGKLINVTGRGSREPVPLQNAYASSKAWVRNFTLALAKEYKDSGVGIFLMAPGMMTTEMLTQVDVVAGYELRLRAMPTILRMWANPPEVAAERMVWLASAATDGKTGIESRVMSPAGMLGGALGEGLRRLTGRKAEPIQVNVNPIPSVLKKD